MNASPGEETIFAEALRLPPDQRAAYIAASTRENPELRRRVESLLSSYDAGDFLEQAAAPQGGPTRHATVPLTEKPGDRIGRYKLLEQICEGGCGVDANGDKFYGPFSRFDGYHLVWPGTWVAEIDVYLDPAWAAGQGFDYSVAANGSDGNHERDYIFHVTKDTSTGKLLVAGSNNTNFEPREDLETINHYEVGTAGWYTLKHRFHDAGGHLAVDLILLDSAGSVLFTETRSSLGDTIPGEVGGNRYAWFTFVSVAGGIRVDNHQRFEYGPTYPTGKATFGFVSKYQKNASVPTGSTEFVFQAAGLNFHSSSYEWLVVNKSDLRAQFKGAGTVNGVGPYKFMLWAFDGTPSGTPDTFRIKIWEEAPDETEWVVYDNGFDGSGFETGQPIGGGNVLVHVSRK